MDKRFRAVFGENHQKPVGACNNIGIPSGMMSQQVVDLRRRDRRAVVQYECLVVSADDATSKALILT